MRLANKNYTFFTSKIFRLSIGFQRTLGSVPERSPKFSKLNSSDLDFFSEVVGPQGFLTDPQDLEAYNVDWLGKFRGNSKLALRPQTTEQVSKILQYCNERKLAVVPQGGNTGLVGGSVPVFDEIILSLQRMNKIIAFDSVSGALTCESGVILQKIDEHVSKWGYTTPLDLGAKGSCHIGGNVSTNAGGIRFLRYGSLHGSVLGLEAVLADGRVLNNLNTLKKDNTGYDLKQLFIGSEGTLGVITGISLACPYKPQSVNVALVGCDTYEETQKVLLSAKKDLGEILSAFEFFDTEALELLLSKDKNAVDPLGTKCRFYLLIETSGSDSSHDKEKVNNFLEKILSAGHIKDGTIAQDESQASSIWYLREHITEALKKTGYNYKYDITLPSPNFYDIVEQIRKRLSPDLAKVVGYGHMADGNMHLNIVSPTKSDQVLSQIEPFVYEYCATNKGSISAEHGIGLFKIEALKYSKPSAMIQVMRTLKQTLDPNGILNPYKVIPTHD